MDKVLGKMVKLILFIARVSNLSLIGTQLCGSHYLSSSNLHFTLLNALTKSAESTTAMPPLPPFDGCSLGPW